MKKIESVMEKKIEFLNPGDSVRQAANRMKSSNVGALPVCSDGKVLGMLTDRDIVVRVISEGRDPDTLPVESVMTHEIVSIRGDQELDKAAELMETKRVGRLVVLDSNGQIEGILSLGNLTHFLGKDRLATVIREGLRAA